MRSTSRQTIRPFLGIGVLSGFTTFSTYALDIQRLVSDRHDRLALLYLATTVTGALAAVWMTGEVEER
jgi:CrcB protein